MTSTLFMLRENEIKVFRVVDGIKDGKDSASRITDCFSLVRVPVFNLYE